MLLWNQKAVPGKQGTVVEKSERLLIFVNDEAVDLSRRHLAEDTRHHQSTPSVISRQACRTVSRFLYPCGQQSFILAGHYCPAPATYPRVKRSGPLLPSYLVLLRVGFALPARIAPAAVRSYRTFS